MISNKGLAHKLYQNLGKLFYAVAAIDNNVRDEELDRLRDVVKNEWLKSNLIQDDLKANIEDSIINTFKWLHDDNEYNAEICYNSFIAFKNKHEALFTKDLNTIILETTRAITASFSGVNKSELIIMARLSLELNK